MSEPRWTDIERLFDGALDRPASERAAWLAASGAPAGVRAEVARMLAAHERVRGVLDRPLPTLGGADVGPRLQEALAGRYTIGVQIGRGGMATVLLAREAKHDRQVVLKVLKPEVAAAFGVRRFLAEIQIAARLSHPHILGLIDSGEAGGLLYYVMPYVGGHTLRVRLEQAEPLSVPEAVTLLADIASALAYAHAQGIVHRDLKPENVLVVDGHAFLLDFGIAKLRSAARAERLTALGQALGTPGYMAPEQQAGRLDVDHRADLYAWGLVATELLTGAPVPAPDLTDVRPDTPPRLAQLIARTLAQRPEGRPTEAAELVRELGRTSAAFTRPAARGRRLGVALAALLAVGAVAGWAVRAATRDDARLPGPIAVAALRNETNDSTLDGWGRLAGDWLTRGLQEAALAPVVPWPAALDASNQYRALRQAGGSADPVSVLHRELNAGTVVTGAYYLVSGDVRLQLEITNARTGALLAAPPPVVVSRDSVGEALRLLRDRLLGALAVSADERAAELPGLSERPPTYEAYQAFQRGMELHNGQDYREAAAQFHQAIALDSTFNVARVYAAMSLWNTGDYAAADSMLTVARRPGAHLSEYHERLAEHLRATLAGDGARALREITRAVEVAPGSRATYNAAIIATALNRPRQALDLLETLDPDRGAMRGWSSYWTQLTHARHLLGEHAREAQAARALRARFPDRRVGLALEVRALAAMGKTEAIDSALAAADLLPPATYWSQGAAMVIAGEELAAHGFTELAPGYWERAERWFANQLAAEPDNYSHRYWLGSALYDAGRWQDAAPYFASLVRDRPNATEPRGLWAMIAARQGDTAEAERRLGPAPPYDRGEHTVFRARIAAVTGARDRAVDLMAEALSVGVGNWTWLHASALRDLGSLNTDPRYVRLIQSDHK